MLELGSSMLRGVLLDPPAKREHDEDGETSTLSSDAVGLLCARHCEGGRQGSAIGQAPHQILSGYHCMSLPPFQTHEAGSFFRWNSEGLSNA